MKTKLIILGAVAIVGVLALSTRFHRQEESLSSITNQLQQVNAQIASPVIQPTNQAPARTMRFVGQPGSKVRMDGTSTIHDWNVESRIVGGFVEFEEGFNLTELKPGKVRARVEAMIPVASLKSSSGPPMDSIMYEAMKKAQFPKIEYRLQELVLKQAPNTFEATGELVVSGSTNKLTMPLTIESLTNNQYRCAGGTALRMTDFGIKPPAPDLGGLTPIKTGNEVKVTFEWVVMLKPEVHTPPPGRRD